MLLAFALALVLSWISGFVVFQLFMTGRQVARSLRGGTHRALAHTPTGGDSR